MPTDLQTRTQYLALAEFCQSIIWPLCDYVEGTASLPTATLEKMRAALQSVTSGDPYRFGQRTAAALGSYEQVRTLEEVWKTPEQINSALELTVALLDDGGGTADTTSKAKMLIDLFLKLQATALWNFEQPKRTTPPDIWELCKALKTA